VSRAARRTRLAEEPWVFDILELLRELERSHPDKPRIGTAARPSEEIVEIRQEPFLAFPACNVTRVEPPGKPGDPLHLFVQFMGLFGPNGPLPLTTTLEAYHWIHRRNDPAFARFADMFSTRFVQLFYRAWADARPIVQMGRPAEDRFRAWTGALIGHGTPGLSGRDSLPDDTRRHLLGLWGARVRSATRLLQILREVMAMEVTLTERVGTWLDFSPDDHSRLGGPRAALGRNCCLGARAWSVNHKIRVTLHCRSLAEYERCLPGRPDCTRLGDTLRSYLGPTQEAEIALTLPAAHLPATRLGQAGQLGWTSFALCPSDPDTAPDTAPDTPPEPEAAPRLCAVFPVPLDAPANSDRRPPT
jgi:type VI secretion system protein ImpH